MSNIADASPKYAQGGKQRDREAEGRGKQRDGAFREAEGRSI